MDSKVIEVIEHNWYAFGEIVNAPGDAVRTDLLADEEEAKAE